MPQALPAACCVEGPSSCGRGRGDDILAAVREGLEYLALQKDMAAGEEDWGGMVAQMEAPA